jgi:hypothetical protein
MAKVNIENINLTLYIQPEATTGVSAQKDVSDDELVGYPTEAVDAEKALFDGAYWDDMLHAAEDEFEKEPEFFVGDLVEFITEDDDDYGELEMNGLIGRVYSEDEESSTLIVEFFNWRKGHDAGFEDDSESRWYCERSQLKLLED